MIDKLAELNRDSNDNDFQKLLERKEELENRMEREEKQTVYLTDENKNLVLNLQKVKNRYKREQTLKNRNKRQLNKIVKSRSWRFSLPIRKIGRLFKNTQSKANTPKVENYSQSKGNKPSVINNSYSKGNTTHNVKRKRDKDIIALKKKPAKAIDLEKKLWGGYSSYALDELESLKNSPSVSKYEKMKAARSISRWYYDKHQFHKAYEELEYINKLKPLNNPDPGRIIPEVKVLKKLGYLNIAKKKIWDAMESSGLQSELCLSMAHLTDKENERLNWYNLLYDKHGYNQIDKIDDSKPLDLENIYTPVSEVDKELEKYKVSVIIPAYNAADLIHITLNSLLNQTIQNLEVIVVDDCSPDNTAEVVSKFAEKDNRIKLIKKEKNEGAYAARNTGLQFATGDFITIHDSDDWSHSQKFEVQLKELVKNSMAVGSISFLVRASKDTTPLNGGSLLSVKYLMLNSSSLLVRKSVITKLGGWDSVRVAGDTEFLWRIEKVFGEKSVIRVEPKVPFSIALSNESSLTGTSTTHVKTIRFGLRRTYRESFVWWHSQAKSTEELYMNPKKVNRQFPCPIPNMLLKTDSRNYDSVLFADFSNESDQDMLIDILEYLTSRDEKLAIFHWPTYEGNPDRTMVADIYHLIYKKGIDILVPNEEIEAGKLLFLTPRILEYVLDSAPNIKYNQAFIVSDEKMSSESKMRKEKNLEQKMHIYAEWCSIQNLKNN